MNQAIKITVLVGIATFTASCYHATVETGLIASGQTKKIWAHSWIYGLVPPSVVEAQRKCASGVARVETQLTFANQLVSFLTFYIYTPIQIEVTCAQVSAIQNIESRQITLGHYDIDYESVMGAFSDAADSSVKTGGPVFVVFHDGAH